MRNLILFILVATAANCSAERLMSIPTARKLPQGILKIEYDVEAGSGRTELSYAEFNLNHSFEIGLRREQLRGQTVFGGGDVTYNIISAIPGITPGFAAGVTDVSNQTPDGRRAFFCGTFREPVNTLNGENYADITLGVFFGTGGGGLLGLSLPFSKEFRMMADHNGKRLMAGIEFRPIPTVGLRMMSRSNDILFGMNVSLRF